MDISTLDQLKDAVHGVALRIGASPFFVILLEGELGAGKTTFTQTLGALLGATDVQSPTYSLLRTHDLPDGRQLHHLDLYRVEHREELEVAGVMDLFWSREGIFVVEWPRFLEDVLPGAPVIHCLLELHSDGSRILTLR